MFRKITLTYGPVQCGLCGKQLRRITCWGRKLPYGWGYRCFQCVPSNTDPATIQ